MRELRLAIVCYGGSSLAVYMHGVTKEIHRLVKGSALLDSPAGPHSGSASERMYAELLHKLAQDHPERVRTRVIVDVIAGTSAGGINGICLAKALAHNLSQDQFRDLWFEHGDIKGLLAAPKIVPTRKLKAGWAALRARKHAPLRGEVMAQWVYDAFARMDKEGPNPASQSSLLPHGHLLELFVTITDFYGYGRQVPYTDPNPIHDTRHRHILAFRYGGDDGRDDFNTDSNGALTFAARTTSSIPGVFPPVSFASLVDWLDGRALDLNQLKRRFFRLYELSKFPPEWTWFVDGGVLDNKPFGPAIAAMRERSADVEVERRLLYLEPDPSDDRTPSRQTPPSTVAAAIGGLTGLPRSEPILDDLVEIAALNERVRRIADIIESSWTSVETRVRAIVGPLGAIPRHPASPELAHTKALLDEQARIRADFSYATYVRLKISGVVDRYAETACAVCELPADSTHALLARSVLRTWARERGLFHQGVEPTPKQRDFLIDFDLDYGQRRLRFVIDGLNAWYQSLESPGYPARKEIDTVKGRLWQAISTLRQAMAGTTFADELTTRYTTCFPVDAMREFLQRSGFDAEAYVSQHNDELDALERDLASSLQTNLAGFTEELYTDLLRIAENWDPQRQWELLIRYLGFPFWDVLLYPIQALSDVGERDEVKIVRISPRDSRRIPALPGGRAKLKGAEDHHFGAFLSRSGRENDYLWGRLDCAERLVGLLLKGPSGKDSDDWSKKAFQAILDEDENAVPNALELVRHVQTTIKSSG